MSATPSPSKRPRIPTSSAVHSATASPFPSTTTSRPNNGPRSVGPSGTSAGAGLGMSPADAFSFVPVASGGEAYGMSGFTPYSTTSPAYISGAASEGAGISAASPISAALAHGTRILSSIQAGSPFYSNTGNGTPMMGQQPYPAGRYPMQQVNFMGPGNVQNPMSLQHQQKQQQQQQQQKVVAPQPGSPEYLKLALSHLQNTLLARLESEAEGFFDAADTALGANADTRTIAGKASSFHSALENVLSYLEKDGLASIPLLPLPESTESTSDGKIGDISTNTNSTSTATAAGVNPGAEETIIKEDGEATKTGNGEIPNQAKAEGEGVTKLEVEIAQLQKEAKELFDRRQRLKESASIVSGILDS